MPDKEAAERLARLEVKMEDVREEVHNANNKLDQLLTLVQSQGERIASLETQRNWTAGAAVVLFSIFSLWATIHWG